MNTHINAWPGFISLSAFFSGSGIGFNSSLEGTGSTFVGKFTWDSDGAGCMLAMMDRETRRKALKNLFDSAFDLLCTGDSRVVYGAPVMLPIGDRLLHTTTRINVGPTVRGRYTR